MKTTTIGDLVAIQAEQLEQWGRVLKPDVHAALCEIVREQTDRAYYDPQVACAVALPEDYDNIIRGSYIDEKVKNFSMGNRWR